MYTYVYIYIHVYVYIYTYIHIYMYIHVCIHIHLQTLLETSGAELMSDSAAPRLSAPRARVAESIRC